MTGKAPNVVVVGLGNAYRRDDAVGGLVAERAVEEASRNLALRGRIRSLGPLADPLELLTLWDRSECVILVDAVRSGEVPGTVRVLEESKVPELAPQGYVSTHAVTLDRVLHLAPLVGKEALRLRIVTVEGEDFGNGAGLSEAVLSAVPAAVDRVVRLAEEMLGCA